MDKRVDLTIHRSPGGFRVLESEADIVDRRGRDQVGENVVAYAHHLHGAQTQVGKHVAVVAELVIRKNLQDHVAIGCFFDLLSRCLDMRRCRVIRRQVDTKLYDDPFRGPGTLRRIEAAAPAPAPIRSAACSAFPVSCFLPFSWMSLARSRKAPSDCAPECHPRPADPYPDLQQCEELSVIDRRAFMRRMRPVASPQHSVRPGGNEGFHQGLADAVAHLATGFRPVDSAGRGLVVARGTPRLSVAACSFIRVTSSSATTMASSSFRKPSSGKQSSARRSKWRARIRHAAISNAAISCAMSTTATASFEE